jgi:dihydroorotate dehydrogenase
MYKVLRSVLFLFPPEMAHRVSMNLLKLFCSFTAIQKILSKIFTHPLIPVHLQGLTFKNPVGLGAGFDKNAKYLRELETVGFGFVEIGTVTPRPQPGNSKPRVFRLIKDKALINRMGFNNDGVEAVAERLKRWRKRKRSMAGNQYKDAAHFPMLIGGNIGKNKVTPNEDAWKDYEICFRALHPYVDFFVVNVSSPNTPGLRALQEKSSLKKILTHLQNLNASFEIQRPVFLKIAPDLGWAQLDDVLDLAKEISLDGLVATNTTTDRNKLQTAHGKVQAIGAGGLSGKPLQKRSTEIVQYVHQKAGANMPIIASGGIFTGADAKEKISSGASLIEVWTGFIYEGPLMIKRICRELV